MDNNKYILLGIGAIIALTACSNDEVVDQQATDLISYDIITTNATRALAVHKAGEGVNFLVSAAVARPDADPNQDYTAYFTNDQIYYSSDDGGKYTSAHTRYWPTGDTKLDFLAYHGETHAGTSTNIYTPVMGYGYVAESSTYYTKLSIGNVQIADLASNQEDILYAVAKQAARGTSGTVSLNFRHALARLDFYIKNISQNLYIEVENVTLCNVYKKGDVEWGRYTTEKNYPTMVTGYTYSDDCTWSSKSNKGDISSVSTTTTTDYMGFKYGVSDAKRFNADDPDVTTAMLVIPDTYETAAVPTTGTTWSDADGVYVKIKCRIYNISDITAFTTAIANKTAAEVHSLIVGTDTAKPMGAAVFTAANDGFGDLYVPIDRIGEYKQGSGQDVSGEQKMVFNNIGWLSGKRYNYTFVFGSGGAGGYDGDANTVMVPLSVEATSDDWYTATSSSISTEL